MIAVVGGGTMGLAVAWALARRGAEVLVLERHGHVHDLGSHSGFTRVIRQAYHEGADYVPLVQEADEAWCGLAQRCGRSLLVRAGLLEFGSLDDPNFAAAVEACRIHRIEHHCLSADEARQRYPFVLPNHWTACLTPSGGYLRVGACLDALRDEAVAAGAIVRAPIEVREVERVGGRLHVLTDEGPIAADRVVLTAGAGMARLVPHAPLSPLRRVMLWIDVGDTPALRDLPVWAAFTSEGFFYGFPWSDADGVVGLKIALHRTVDGIDEVPIDPEIVMRSLSENDVAPVRSFARRYFPSADGALAGYRVCLYTMTPDGHFVIDRHPDDPDMFVVGGFSGHGFKFAPAVGRLVADMVLDDASARPDFAFDRFGGHER